MAMAGSDGSMMTRWSAAAATPRSGRRGARKEWTLGLVQFQSSKFQKKFPAQELNLDEIKNALRLLSVNGETNIMNLIRL